MPHDSAHPHSHDGILSPIVVPISGRRGFLHVHNIYCVGRNYWAHREEMGVTDRDPPFFFQKRLDSLVFCPPDEPKSIPYPPGTSDFHHEIELVVGLNKGGFEVSEADAASLIFGYAVGLDMTRRDLQAAAKAKGRPWDDGKNFESAAPIGEIVPLSDTGEIVDGRIALSVNGEIRQEARLDEMITSVSETIAALSRLHRLHPGDLIYTGTPAGVGPVVSGDTMRGEIENVGAIEVRVA